VLEQPVVAQHLERQTIADADAGVTLSRSATALFVTGPPTRSSST
jgi:hypothetical protein